VSLGIWVEVGEEGFSVSSGDVGRAVRFVLFGSVVGVVLFLVASYFLALLLGPTLFFLTPKGVASSGQFLDVLPIQLFGVFDLFVPVGLSWGSLFLLLWGVFLVCFVVSWGWRKSLHRVVGEALSRSAGGWFDNWLFTMAVVASVLLAAFVLITALQNVVGVETGVPSLPENSFEAYLTLAYATLAEEISLRISPIGLFLAVYLFLAGGNAVAAMSFWRRAKLFFAAFLCPDKAKGTVGFRTVAANGFKGGISLGEWVMVLVTALVFGLMHLVSGVGWGPGKVTTAFMNGFVFGLVYLAYGFQAPILLHWFLNYYFYTYFLAAEFYPSVYSLMVLLESVNIYVGLFGLFAFGVLALRRTPKTVPERKLFEFGSPLPA